MPWLTSFKALDLVGHDRKDELQRAFRAGDVKTRQRDEDGAARGLHPSEWSFVVEVDWQASRAAMRRHSMIILGGPPPDWWIESVPFEIDQASLLENFPPKEQTQGGREVPRAVPSNRRQGAPEGLTQWYINEHIRAGYSTREQDLAAARERFGDWTKAKDTMRDLRDEYAPPEWKKPGPKIRPK
jgi:hypothetical protein